MASSISESLSTVGCLLESLQDGALNEAVLGGVTTGSEFDQLVQFVDVVPINGVSAEDPERGLDVRSRVDETQVMACRALLRRWPRGRASLGEAWISETDGCPKRRRVNEVDWRLAMNRAYEALRPETNLGISECSEQAVDNLQLTKGALECLFSRECSSLAASRYHRPCTSISRDGDTPKR
jgi:hypothetical protein